MTVESNVIHLTGDFWGVKVNGSGFNYTLFGGWSIDQIRYTTMPSPGRFKQYVVNIPPGMWSILSLAKDLREEQWGGIVEWYTDSHDSSYDPMYNVTTYFDVFKDYVTGDEGELATATQSGHSLLVSKNLDLNTTLIIKKESK